MEKTLALSPSSLKKKKKTTFRPKIAEDVGTNRTSRHLIQQTSIGAQTLPMSLHDHHLDQLLETWVKFQGRTLYPCSEFDGSSTLIHNFSRELSMDACQAKSPLQVGTIKSRHDPCKVDNLPIQEFPRDS